MDFGIGMVLSTGFGKFADICVRQANPSGSVTILLNTYIKLCGYANLSVTLNCIKDHQSSNGRNTGVSPNCFNQKQSVDFDEMGWGGVGFSV